MERVRQASYADLHNRRMSGQIRALMFLHMKQGLDADTIRLPFSQESYQLERTMLTPSGVQKDFQRAPAELRTDLDAFTVLESRSLMACGYRMASKAYEKHIASAVPELGGPPVTADWPFQDMQCGNSPTAHGACQRRAVYIRPRSTWGGFCILEAANMDEALGG